jgi:photosystem II stability/assembly factor-like uncharacterized protein
MIERCKSALALTVAVLVPAVVFAQQGWTQGQTIKQGGGGASVNAVFYDGSTIWVVGARGFIARSYDDGETFNESHAGIDEGLNDVYKRGNKIWIVGDHGTILRSMDDGRTFIRATSSPAGGPGGGAPNKGEPIDLYSVFFTDPNRGFIVGDHGLILVSTDSGLSWHEQRSGTDSQLFHLSIVGERGWVVGTGGLVLHTSDGGKNWYPQRSGVSEDLNRVYMVDDQKGLITGDKGTLLETENGGATWSRVSLRVNEPLFGVSFTDKKTGWVVGYGGRIIRTYDGGHNWVEQSSGTQADLFGVSFNKNRGYAIGRDGIVMRYYERR